MKQPKFLIPVLIILLVAVLWGIKSCNSEKTVPDYSNTIQQIQEQQKKDKQEMLDSLRATQDIIIKQKKSISGLESMVSSQRQELDKIKKQYEINRNNINNLDADGTVSESRRQLSGKGSD